MISTALITGASSGIGFELAQLHAAKGDHLVLVARSTDKLLALKSELESKYKIQVLVLPTDLSLPDAAKTVFEAVEKTNVEVTYLINNAGFGDFGFFSALAWERTNEMIQLNITALTQLTHLFLPGMIARKNGKILNVASTAAFQPGPLMAVYFATKAYVLSFSEAIGNELSEHNITVTALCPGPTLSGFQAAAQMKDAKATKANLPTSAQVASFGYAAMMRGKPVAIEGFANWFLVGTLRLAPRKAVVKLTRFILSKLG